MSNLFVTDLIDEMKKVSPAAHLRVVALLARYSGSSVYIPSQSKAERRQRAAAHMLESCMCGDEIATALRLRFSISARQAWRDIAAAKSLRQMPEK